VAEEITVFITMAFGPAYLFSSEGPPAPPLMKSPVMKIIRVPVVSIVKLVGWKVLSMVFIKLEYHQDLL